MQRIFLMTCWNSIIDAIVGESTWRRLLSGRYSIWHLCEGQFPRPRCGILQVFEISFEGGAYIRSTSMRSGGILQVFEITFKGRPRTQYFNEELASC